MSRWLMVAVAALLVWSVSVAAGSGAAAAVVRCDGEVATLVGTSGPDTLIGTSGRDVIVGLGGADTIDGRGGADLICGGGGADVIMGGPKGDVIFGQGGADTIEGGTGPDVIWGQGGKDVIYGGSHGDEIRGGSHRDKIWGEDGADLILGAGGDDRLIGGKGNDDLRGGGGHDLLRGNGGADSLAGGPGTDDCKGGGGNDTASGCEATLPDGAVVVSPGDDLEAIVESSPEGTHFYLEAGVYRLVSFTPRSGQVFEGERGPNGERLAILSGARRLTSFSRSNGLWVAENQTQEAPIRGFCSQGRPGCAYSNDLFIDDVALEQVTSLGDVEAGTWFFDYAADRIYFADDPTGRTVETSVTERAINGQDAANVTLNGIVVEKYANPAQQGAVHLVAAIWGNGPPRSPGWLVDDSEFRHNHGAGLAMSDTMVIRNSYFHHNGQIGLGGAGDDVLVVGNEIAHNNVAGFSAQWEAGGTKFVKTQNLIVRNNDVHHNDGKGLWSDIDNIDVLIEDNHVYDNSGQGIYQEIGYDAIIRNNLVERNGFANLNGVAGAGIMVNSSRNVEVYGNTVIDNVDGITGQMDDRGDGLYGPYVLENLDVHDNCIEMSMGVTGIVDYSNNPDPTFTTRNNQFDFNTYRLDGVGDFYLWSGDFMDAAGWQGTGNGANSTWQQDPCP